MGGEATGKVVSMEPARKARVYRGRGGGLGARVEALEARMEKVETGITTAAENAALAVANTAELLAIAKATKGAFGFIRKHGPKAISFGAGIMTILGFGNPKLWEYISHFFGA